MQAALHFGPCAWRKTMRHEGRKNAVGNSPGVDYREIRAAQRHRQSVEGTDNELAQRSWEDAVDVSDGSLVGREAVHERNEQDDPQRSQKSECRSERFLRLQRSERECRMPCFVHDAPLLTGALVLVTEDGRVLGFSRRLVNSRLG